MGMKSECRPFGSPVDGVRWQLASGSKNSEQMGDERKAVESEIGEWSWMWMENEGRRKKRMDG
jgi:hypothetical protein